MMHRLWAGLGRDGLRPWAALFAFLIVLAPTTAITQTAQPVDPVTAERLGLPSNAPEARIVRIPLSKADLVELPEAVRDIIVADPEIADVIVKTPKQVYLVGRSVGDTNVFFIGEDGGVVEHVDVRVEVASLILSLLEAGLPVTTVAGAFLDQVNQLLDSHERIKAAKAAIQTKHEAVSSTRKEWFPVFSISAFRGKEYRNNVSPTLDTRLHTHEIGLTMTQPVFDFGVRDTTTEIAKSEVTQSELTLELTKQGLLFEAISAHVNLTSATLIHRYSRQSVENIKKQTNLEDTRIAKGAGLSTDALQSKVQLAGAKARSIRSNGALKIAETRYQALFGKIPFNLLDAERILIPSVKLDKTLEELVEITLDSNIQLALLDKNRQISKKNISLQKSTAWGPDISIIAERRYKRNVGGTVGSTDETTVKLQFTYDLNLGFSSLNTINTARLGYVSTDNLFYDARRLIVESIKTAYVQFKTAKENYLMLKEQAKLSSAFLVLARKERKLGKRSLIDVLAGETAEINARSDAAAAQASVVLGAYTILNVMGVLTPENIKTKTSSQQ
jgi:adhesin transport system outer membrane protein